MAQILKTKSIYYNDVNILSNPAHYAMKSRTDIPKELNRIIVSPMEAVVGKTFAKEASALGLTVCLHRFGKLNEQLDIFKECENPQNTFVSIGMNDWERVDAFKDINENWLIDCANGYLHNVKNVIYQLKTKTNIKKLMVGNVHTAAGIDMYKEFAEDKFDMYFRVGIAGGSACATSDVTGVNRGQITEIMECSEAAKKYERFHVIADGGVKNGNYAAKAFGAGASYVMMGGFFSKTKEAETNIIGDGTYWGGASHKQQLRQHGEIKRHSEGKVLTIEKADIESLSSKVDTLWGGLSSTVSYTGYDTLTNFIGNATFEVKQNSLPPNGR